MPASFTTQETGRLPASAGPELYRHGGRQASFEIYRAEWVSLTSILFSGGDWRWRFHSAAGTILVNSEGYNSEAACRAAITALQNHAGAARITVRGRC